MGSSSACGTFVAGDDRAGIDETGHVGACHRSECVHNSQLECAAGRVGIGPAADVADCLTYSAR